MRMHPLPAASLIILAALVTVPREIRAQCCSAGSGNGMVGGAAQGVLPEHQLELGTSFQFLCTETFYRDQQRVEDRTFDGFRSRYLYYKLAYGASPKLTVSLEVGQYLLKEELGLKNDPATTFTSSGIGDLVVFPRYQVLHSSTRKAVNEVVIGLGQKFPLGTYNDSAGRVEPFSGQTYYITKPTAVQLSSGAQDAVFHLFLHHGFVRSGVKLSASALHIRTGWNPNGEKLGNFTSAALFVSRSFHDVFGLTVQARYETVSRMQINGNILLFGKPTNYFPEATGYHKVFLTPQVSFTRGAFTIHATTDLPLYQRMNTSAHYTQVGSQQATTVGIAYRFLVKRPAPEVLKVAGRWYCPMHPEESADGPAHCGKCGMDLEQEPAR